MAPSTHHAGKPNMDGMTLSINKRILFLFLACCIQMIYVPTSFRTTGGIEPKLAFDIFPLWPVWVVPYVLCYPLWLAGVAWTLLKMNDRLFRGFIAACVVAFATGTSTFLLFPTYVPAASLSGTDFFTWLLRIIHENWGRYDAFPSGHVYITTLLALFFSRWYPRQRVVWFSILIMVSLSTLFTGQHYIVDVLGGYLVGFIGFRFGLWWAGYLPAPKRSRKPQLLLPPPS